MECPTSISEVNDSAELRASLFYCLAGTKCLRTVVAKMAYPLPGGA